MSPPHTHNGDPDQAISLAKEFIERHRRELRSNFGSVYEKEIERWEERKEGLSTGDPLYAIAEERITENQEKLDQLESGTEPVRRELLSTVSEGFVAQSEWLDSTLFRALNLILFNKYSDTLVVDRTVLDEHTELEDEKLYEVSRKVRELTKSRLEEH